MKQFLIFGTGGHAKVVYSILNRCGYDVAAFVAPLDSEHEIYGLPIIGEDQVTVKDYFFALGIGNTVTRKMIMTKFGSENFPFITDPSSVILGNLGYGTVVCPLAYVGPDSFVGQGCIVNSGASIDHDCRVAEFVNINPKAVLAGNVKITNPHTFIGMGALIREGLTITESVKMGMVIKYNTFDGLRDRLIGH